MNARREKRRQYKHEFTTDDHKELISICGNMKGMVLLSGYENEIYRSLENDGWTKYIFEINISSEKLDGYKRKKAQECIWANKQLTNRLNDERCPLFF